MNSEAIDALIGRHPDLKTARVQLEAMQPGAYCLHRSWGFGRINSYDEVQEKLVIDFEQGPKRTMDPIFCISKLELLSYDHILARQRTESEHIQGLITKRPVELIIEILRVAPNQCHRALELERILKLLLGEALFKKWWARTKRQLVKDPHISTPDKKLGTYVLRKAPVTPEEEILETFRGITTAKEKIQLAAQLLQLAESVEAIEKDLPYIFDTLTHCIQKTSNLTEAERLYGIWVRNDLGRHLHKDVERIDPTSASLIKKNERNLSELATQLPKTHQSRFLDLLIRVYPDDKKTVILQQLSESSGRYINECIYCLTALGYYEEIAASLKKWLYDQTLSPALLLWIIKNRRSKKFERLIRDLMNPRLLNALFTAIDNATLQHESVRKTPLGEYLLDAPQLVNDLLADADTETASDLAQTLLLNQGFGNLEKKSLLARFIKKFPSIKNLLSGQASHLKQAVFFVSQTSFDRRKKQYEELVKVKIPENQQAILRAREQGDLRENAEYKMAKEEEQTLLAVKSALEQEFARVRITDFRDASKTTVGIGSIVKVIQPATQKTHIFSILGAWDSDPARNIIAYITPLGKRLSGKKVGDTVTTTLDGDEAEWHIEAIYRLHDLLEELRTNDPENATKFAAPATINPQDILLVQQL